MMNVEQVDNAGIMNGDAVSTIYIVTATRLANT